MANLQKGDLGLLSNVPQEWFDQMWYAESVFVRCGESTHAVALSKRSNRPKGASIAQLRENLLTRITVAFRNIFAFSRNEFRASDVSTTLTEQLGIQYITQPGASHEGPCLHSGQKCVYA